MLYLVKTPKGELSATINMGSITKVWDSGQRWTWLKGSLYGFRKGTKVILPREVDPRANLDVLKQYAVVAELIQGQIGMVLKNGIFSEFLVPGFHAYWKGYDKLEIKVFNTKELELPEDLEIDHRALMASNGFIRVFRVKSGEKALLLKDGALFRELEPGEYFFWNNQISFELLSVNVLRRSVELNGQELLTKDKATLRINMIADMRVVNPKLALLENSAYEKQAYLMLSMALRAYVAELSLDELLSRKLDLAEKVAETTLAKFSEIGLELIEVGIRDIILPGEMREIMNEVLMAEKRAQANLIMRREETSSTRSLMNTAKLMEYNPMLWKLKEMEYLEKVVEKVGEITIKGGNLGSRLQEIFSSA